ncbi:MAG: tRNA (guanosine(46)-N7)-methyltransferase TrmB [Treponema sp.]|jgi:tRNA (guanine-N7-)-methyltransferase|nr:tRNA (guanosine(46)-N7)-methyltransferase TrmB [Treponema sp.]
MDKEMSEQSAAQEYRIRSYVLRAGRMSDSQRRSYEALFPRYGIPFDTVALDYTSVFSKRNPLIIEIGFGMGIATAMIAEANPGVNYLGIEVHRPGIGKLLWEIERRNLSNVRIIEHDAVETLERMIPAASVAGFHIFFPDPWPKKRHHKRRLITRPFTDLLASRLVPGGYLYMVTDWAEYGDWALAELSATQGLLNAYDGFALPQSWRPETRFERKGIEKQHIVRELYFKQGKI